MKVGVTTRWLFPEELADKKISGEFTGTSTCTTKNGDQMEYAVFVAEDGTEYQIAGWNLVTDQPTEINTQQAELSRDGKKIRVKFL